jgi:hypothetical protein
MKIQSARDLKLEIASEVFAPIANDLLKRALNPKLGTILATSPLRRIALGIARGRAPSEFTLAVRLQAKSTLLQKVVDLVREKAADEIDVRFVGRVRAHDDPNAIADLRKVCRPLLIGCSVAHIASTAGTLGLIARHRKSARSVMVSNTHVLAQTGQAKLGDAITQPGRLDGASSDDHVAALLDFVPLKMSGSNQVDAAVAVIEDSVPLAPNSLPGIGPFTIPGDSEVSPGMKVIKLGRTTGHRQGEIVATELDDIAVDYDVGTATFDDQIEITGMPGLPFSDRGDSGSLVLDENMQAIGLIFCGNPNANDGRGMSYANHLPKVLAGLDLIPL